MVGTVDKHKTTSHLSSGRHEFFAKQAERQERCSSVPVQFMRLSDWWRAGKRGESLCLALFFGPVLPRPVPRDQSSPPLYDFPNMLESVSTECVVTGCLYKGFEAISYLARDRAFWNRVNSRRS